MKFIMLSWGVWAWGGAHILGANTSNFQAINKKYFLFQLKGAFIFILVVKVTSFYSVCEKYFSKSPLTNFSINFLTIFIEIISSIIVKLKKTTIQLGAFIFLPDTQKHSYHIILVKETRLFSEQTAT